MCEFMSCLDVMSGLSAWPLPNGSEPVRQCVYCVTYHMCVRVFNQHA